MDAVLPILMRWIHVMTACVAVGGMFFLRIVLPAAMSRLDEASRQSVTAAVRRIWKHVFHTSMLLFLISGTYNAWRQWGQYRSSGQPPLAHALLGSHLLLALGVFTLSMILLAGQKPRAGQRTWLAVNLVLLMLTVAAACGLKWVRERPLAGPVAAREATLLHQAPGANP